MFLRIEKTEERKLAGMHLAMSLQHNRTIDLWRSFMPRKSDISNKLTNNLFSLQVYPPSYSFQNFDPAAQFVKWAAVEVADFAMLPVGIDAFVLPAGQYAVFLHKGPASEGEKTFRYIFETWLPSSGYVLDDRPHFEILGAKYRNDSPGSEEEVWIPVKVRM